MEITNKLIKKVIKVIAEKESISDELIISQYKDPLYVLRRLIDESKDLTPTISALDNVSFYVPKIAKSVGLNDDGSLDIYEQSGLFRVSISNGGFVYILKVLNAETTEYITLAFATESSWKNYNAIKENVFKTLNKPRVGVFKIYVSRYYQGGLEYLEKDIDEFPDIEIVHPEKSRLFSDIDRFFSEGLSEYDRFNLSYLKKSLMFGKSGTGKTSLNRMVAKKYGKNMNVSFVDEFMALKPHLEGISRSEVPSVVIYEDCEQDLENAKSNILNFMDGIDMPYFKQPVYLLASTNYPEKLEERIRRRFDTVFQVGPLRGDFARQCAQGYFADHFTFNGRHSGLFDALTGWEIWKVWLASRDHCKNNGCEFSEEIIKSQIVELKKEFKMIDEAVREKSKIGYRNEPF